MTWSDPLGSVPDNIVAERPACYLAPIIDRILAARVNGHGLRACDGQLDRHHCVPKQRIKRRYPRHDRDDYVLVDSRNLILVCRKHHDLIERKAITLAAEDYPPSVHEFAAEYGFFFDERQGWVAEAPVFACDGIDEAGY